MRTAIGLILILLVLGGGAAFLWRRRSGDEIHSIDNYRHALDTLQDMRGTTGSTSVRVLDSDEAAGLRQPHPPAQIRTGPKRSGPPPEGATAPGPLPKAKDGMVFEDGRPSPEGEGEPSGQDHRHRHHDDPAWAMARAQTHPHVQNRQLVVGAIAAVVILILVLVGILIGQTGSGSSKATTSLPSPSHRSATTRPAPTTTTTRPATLQPQSSTATTASYAVPGSSSTYSLSIATSGGPCWTIVTDGAGKQLYAGGISPGAPQKLQATGTTVVELDAPANATVTVGGAGVAFPSGYSTPLVLTFAPAPPPTTTTVPAGTPTTSTLPPTTAVPIP